MNKVVKEINFSSVFLTQKSNQEQQLQHPIKSDCKKNCALVDCNLQPAASYIPCDLLLPFPFNDLSHFHTNLISRLQPKFGKGPGHTCKNSRMCCVGSLRLEQRNRIQPINYQLLNLILTCEGGRLIPRSFENGSEASRLFMNFRNLEYICQVTTLTHKFAPPPNTTSQNKCTTATKKANQKKSFFTIKHYIYFQCCFCACSYWLNLFSSVVKILNAFSMTERVQYSLSPWQTLLWPYPQILGGRIEEVERRVEIGGEEGRGNGEGKRDRER